MNEESKANGARDILSTEFAKIAFQTLDGPVTITNEVENNLFIELKNLTKDSYPQALYQMHTLLCRIRNYYNRVKIGISPAEEKKAALDAAKTRLQEELKAEGKPEQIWDKILPGKLERFISDNTTLDQEKCLLDQNFIKDEKQSVADYVTANSNEVVSFERVTLG